ncbi:MAG: heavy metal-binding domain-containing protein [Saprospiraceae bacterium]
MKLIIAAIVVFTLAIACKNSSGSTPEATTETPAMTEASAVADSMATMMSDSTMVFACPMHPDVKGKLGDKCPKCNMAMVSVNDTTHMHMDHAH